MAEKDIVMNTMEELKEELLRTIECYYIVDEADRRVICGNSGLISLCGPEIMELPFQEALKGSPPSEPVCAGNVRLLKLGTGP